MENFNVAGLASGFDWNSMIDQLMAVERVPQQRLRAEQRENTDKSDALNLLKTKIETLQSRVKALNSADLFNAKRAELSNSSLNIKASVTTAATKGSYQFDISKLATATKRLGTADVGGGMGDQNSVVSELRLADQVKPGEFTVNGQTITIEATDTLQEVFDNISIATSGVVSASYDAATDKVTLSSASGQLELGSENDKSNFLKALKLDQMEVAAGANGSSTVSSRSTLGVVDTKDAIAASGLAGPVTGAGIIHINGIAIEFDADNESVSALMERVNASTANVTMSYDAVSDQFRMVNKQTGGFAMDVIDSSNGLLSAMGLTGAATVGEDMQFSIDGGAVQTSRSNTLSAQEHGIAGLTVNAAQLGSQTITVGADTAGVKDKVNAFISAFNDVQDYIGEKTKVVVDKDKVKASVLSGNRELSSLDSRLRSLAFTAVQGLASDGLFRLEHLGIDFTSGTSKLEIKDASKFNDALENKLPEMEQFFVGSGEQFAKRFEGFIGTFLSKGGIMETISTKYSKRNTVIDAQIAEMERRLEFKKSALTASFIAMEEAQSRLGNQSSALASLDFGNK